MNEELPGRNRPCWWCDTMSQRITADTARSHAALRSGDRVTAQRITLSSLGRTGPLQPDGHYLRCPLAHPGDARGQLVELLCALFASTLPGADEAEAYRRTVLHAELRQLLDGHLATRDNRRTLWAALIASGVDSARVQELLGAVDFPAARDRFTAPSCLPNSGSNGKVYNRSSRLAGYGIPWRSSTNDVPPE